MRGIRNRLLWVVTLLVVLLAVGCTGSNVKNGAGGTVAKLPAPAATSTASSSSTAPRSSTSITAVPAAGGGPCGFLAPGQAHYSHVVWIWMENHGYGTVIGSAQAPFENELAHHCGLATNYHNVTHPSLPNYIAATSGLPLGDLGRFSSDCDPIASCSASPAVGSVFSQASTWKSYEESMPYPCARGSGGEYAARHNPAVYYQAVAAACSSDDVALPDFYSDLSASTLPAFAFVTPNLIDDTHNAPVPSGDRWLSSFMDTIVSSPSYRAGTMAVFVVWDEGEGGSASNCATNTTDAGCHVPAIVVSPSTTPGTASAGLFNHYSLLRTAEDLLGLPELGEAATAASMVPAFGLG